VVINHLQQIYDSQKCPVICLYLDYKQTSTQSFKNLLGSLLKQLKQLQGSTPLSQHELDWYGKAKWTRLLSKENDIREDLKEQLRNFDRVYLVVDALDECIFRHQLLPELQSLPQEGVSLMVTSRPMDGEERTDKVIDCDQCGARDLNLYFQCSICPLDLCSSCEEKDNSCKAQSHTLSEPSDRVVVDLKTPPEDIRQYVEFEMKNEVGDYGSTRWDARKHHSRPDSTTISRKCRKDPDLITRIPDVIVDRADGRFLFARLYLDSLKLKQTLRDIQDTMDSFPADLNDIYSEALGRIHDQKKSGALGMNIIARVFCARRLLSLAELQHALAIVPGEKDFDTYRDYDKEDILAACIGLITVDSDENAAVRLVHLSLHGYLDYAHEKWIPQAEMDMAQICLTVLNYDTFAEPSANADFDERKQKYPFIAYASQYWSTHSQEAGADPDLDTATLRLVRDPQRVAAYVQASWSTDDRGRLLMTEAVY
jgi:hypothetical protein